MELRGLSKGFIPALGAGQQSFLSKEKGGPKSVPGVQCKSIAKNGEF